MKRVTFGSKPTTNSAPRSPDQWVTAKQASAEPTKRLTIDIPLGLHTRVKSQCALQNLQMADVIRQMLERRFPAEPEHDDPSQPVTDQGTEIQK